MSEERLQEIKDSIEFQYTLAKAKGYDNALLFTNEEEELVEEIERLNKDNDDLQNRFNSLMEAHKICDEENERLNNIINKAIEYIEQESEHINNLLVISEDFDIEIVLDILKGVDKE